MTEHEQLKYICDKIGYMPDLYYQDDFQKYPWINWFIEDLWWIFYEADVREIIFTQEFMDKLLKYREIMQENKNIIWTQKHIDWQNCFNNILDNLNNPTEYLYNLIK